MKTKISITMDSELLAAADKLIDNVLIRNRSQAIEHLLRKSVASERIAVILCGGPDAQLRIGKDYKPTATLDGTTVIERAIKKLKENRFTNIYIIGRTPVLTSIFSTVKDGSGHGVKINYIEEQKSDGTADTLRLIRGKVKERFLVVYADLVFDSINIDALWKQQERQEFTATLLLTTSSEPSEKGTVSIEGNRIIKFIQKPKKSENYIVFSPIFSAEPTLLSYEGDSLEKDVFPGMAEKGLLGGYLSSKKEIHIHTPDDIKRFR
ncbi:NTP transferase domain-containing protein [Candidatus Woesearchaeota archaeon]|nr:NTP transferase domain-containing protein [Candidatus Woesearchaeota archaeon]